VAGLTTIFAIISMVSPVRVLGIGPAALLDAVLFGVVAWRVWVGSRAWAIAGLVLYCFEIIWSVVTHPPGVGILTIIILLALINGVRGTFGLHKYMEMNKPQPVLQSAPSAFATYMPTTSTPPPPPPPVSSQE
jgi:hypothetical protein